jgi:fused signal recognition particle receptor
MAFGKSGIFSRLKRGLSKTHESLVGRIDAVIGSAERIDEDLYEELEESLILADVGAVTAVRLLEQVRERVERDRIKDPQVLKMFLTDEMKNGLRLAGAVGKSRGREPASGDPRVIFVVGVNGVGKTTTVGKLARHYMDQGNSVLICAADTFRAAAVEQLGLWATRVGVEMIRGAGGADPSAVLFDSCAAARARQADLLLVDTAGRLHTKSNLMRELEKMNRVASGEIGGAPHEVLLVLDATTGQNGISQARVFAESIDITGLVLAKLDGSAKGGVALGIVEELGFGVSFVGVGEQVDDLLAFDPDRFVEALFE